MDTRPSLEGEKSESLMTWAAMDWGLEDLKEGGLSEQEKEEEAEAAL